MDAARVPNWDLTLPANHLMISVPSLSKGNFWSSWEVSVHLAEVKLQEGETLENALRRFKRKVQQEDIIKEIKRHSYYLKPGEKKRTKEALARKRNRKKRSKDSE